jgi:hypothetical protein
MSNFAQARAKTETQLSAGVVLPSVLALNTAALLALDQLGGIPGWIKTAVALFLSF